MTMLTGTGAGGAGAGVIVMVPVGAGATNSVGWVAVGVAVIAIVACATTPLLKHVAPGQQSGATSAEHVSSLVEPK